MLSSPLPSQRSSIRRKVLLGFGSVLVMLGAIAFITWHSTRSFMQTAELVAHSRQVLEVAEEVLRHLMEMESSWRGYLITGDSQHLSSHDEARQASRNSLTTLKTLSLKTVAQAQLISRIETLLERIFNLHTSEIAMRRARGAAAAAAHFSRAEGERLTAETRQALLDFAMEERVVLGERMDRLRTVRRATGLVILVGSTLTFLALVSAGAMILRDVAARRRAEEALADQHNLLSSIIDTMPDNVYVKDAKGRYIMNNRAHRHHLRLREGEGIEGKTVFDFFPRELAALYDADDQHVLETGESLRHREEPTLSSDGEEMWLSTTKVPLLDPGGRVLGLVCVSADITERKLAEERLRRFAAQLEQSNAELQNFASVASHDLQEPLRKIQAFGDRLRARFSAPLGELGLDYLGRMQNAAERMRILIQDLLKLSRIMSRAQPFQRCDLGLIVREVLADLEVMVEQQGARVTVDPLPAIDADPLQMRQLFQNLISNGLKFHKRTEPPVVHISGKTFVGKEFVIHGAAPGEEICEIAIQDSGIGFEAEFADRIFVVFQRLHSRSEYEGTGIGLAVCRKITDRHGGAIVAKSAPGQGATFIVTLPVHQPSDEANEE